MLTTILSIISGPTGALAVLMLILYGIYKMANEKAWPLVTKYVDGVDNNFKALLVEHSQDREVFVTTITSLTKRQEKLEDTVSSIEKDVQVLLERK